MSLTFLLDLDRLTRAKVFTQVPVRNPAQWTSPSIERIADRKRVSVETEQEQRMDRNCCSAQSTSPW
jgi:hypothetical protein